MDSSSLLHGFHVILSTFLLYHVHDCGSFHTIGSIDLVLNLSCSPCDASPFFLKVHYVMVKVTALELLMKKVTVLESVVVVKSVLESVVVVLVVYQVVMVLVLVLALSDSVAEDVGFE